jgi:ubiquinone/menaquinone biosynthesis C-methylase UbiE
MTKKSKKNNHFSKKNNIKTKKVSWIEQTKQNVMIYFNHKLSRSWAACDFVKNKDIKCNTAPVTGRGIESYVKHLFADLDGSKDDVFKYLKHRKFLDIGCGINHLYKNALLHKLIKKKYDATGLDLYTFPQKHPNFVSASIMATGLKSNYYDTITSQYFLHYWMDNPKDLLKAFKEIHRILKKNGTLRIYPIYYGNYHYNDNTFIKYIDKYFKVKVIKPKFYREKVAYIYPGEGRKDIKLTNNSVPEKEAQDATTLEASVVIFTKN